MLEATWEAFEDGGQTLEQLRGSRTGVFVGISTTDYAGLQSESNGRSVPDIYSATGSAFSIAANRISYCFDLRGPSLAIDTACSSALSACHVACQSLWSGDYSMAVVAVAAFNSPDSVTLSGEADPLEEIARMLESRGVFNRFHQVRYAFHSHQMDAVKEDLLRALGRVETQPAQLPMLSTVTGATINGDMLDANYWWSNVREPVRFSAAISELCAQGHSLYLELSAHPALTVAVSETLAHCSVAGKAFFSLRRKAPEMATMLTNLSALHVAGSPVEWKSIFPSVRADVQLPSYSWQRERHWIETSASHSERIAPPAHPFLTVKLPTTDPAWSTRIDLSAQAWLKDHCVQDHTIFRGSGYVEATLGMGTTVFDSTSLDLENIEFKKAMVLQEGKGPVQLQSAFSPADATVRFSSRGSGDDGTWTLNATAKLRPRAATRPQTVNLERLKQKFQTKMAKDEIYSACEEHGLS